MTQVVRQTNDICLWRELRKLSKDFLMNIERFYIFGEKCNASVLLTKDRKVFITNSNNHTNPQEIKSLRGEHIFDVISNNYYLYIVVENCESTDDHKIHDIYWMNSSMELKLVRTNVCNYHCYKGSLLVLDDRNKLSWNIIDGIEMIEPTLNVDEMIVDILCSSFHALIVTNFNRLLISKYSSNRRVVTESIVVHESKRIKIKKLIPFENSQCLLISNDDQLYSFNLIDWQTNLFEKAIIRATLIDIEGNRINDIVGTSIGYVISFSNENCWVFDSSCDKMIKTNYNFIADVHCLYLNNSTPFLINLPETLVQSIDEFKSFNNFNECNVILEIKYCDYIIVVNRELLIKYSKYFRQKFEDGEWEDFVFIDKYSYCSLYEYFRFIHCGKLRPLKLWPAEMTIELYEIANEFHDENLLKLIPDKLYDENHIKL